MMTQKQIYSGFDKSSTATEVLAGIDLTGKMAVITGGYSGLGLESTEALVAAGAKVIVAARKVEVAEAALAAIPNTRVIQLDLSDLNSVEQCANGLIDSDTRVDIMLCNAGIMACQETRVGLSNWELQFATNHLGHYALVNRLWAQFNLGARVICVSSAGHHNSPMRWNDVQFSQESSYDKWLAYGQSKTANVLFAVQLDEYGQKDERNIRAFSLHPGKIRTPLQRHLELQEMVAAGWVDENGKVVDSTFKTPEQGAATQVWAATSPQLQGLGGQYLEDCNVAELCDTPNLEFRGVCAHAVDPSEARTLWDHSAKLTEVNAFACV